LPRQREVPAISVTSLWRTARRSFRTAWFMNQSRQTDGASTASATAASATTRWAAGALEIFAESFHISGKAPERGAGPRSGSSVQDGRCGFT